MLCGEHVSHPSVDGVDLNIDRRAHELIRQPVDLDVDGERQCKRVQLSVTLRHCAVVDEAFLHDIKARHRIKLEDTTTNFTHGRLRNEQITALLHAIGGDFGKVDFGGASPCMIAVMYRDAQMLESLLLLSANVNATNCAGVSAVWIAAFYGDLDILEILHNNGAELDAPRRDGETPRAVALRRGHQSVVQWFDDATQHFAPYFKEKGEGLILVAVVTNDRIAVRMLQKYGVSVHGRRYTSGYNNLAHVAAMYGHHLMVTTLHHLGVKLGALNFKGHCPAQLAVVHGHTAVFRALFDHGAKMNACCEETGVNKLMMLAAASNRGLDGGALTRGRAAALRHTARRLCGAAAALRRGKILNSKNPQQAQLNN